MGKSSANSGSISDAHTANAGVQKANTTAYDLEIVPWLPCGIVRATMSMKGHVKSAKAFSMSAMFW